MAKLETLSDVPDAINASSPERRLRVALVSSSSGSRGGGELYLVSLAQGLATLGHDVQCVLAKHERMDELARLVEPFGPVHRLPFRNTYDRRFRNLGAHFSRRETGFLAKRLSALGADVLHVNKQNLEDGLDLLEAARQAAGDLLTTIHVTRTMRQLGARGGRLRDFVAARALRATPCRIIAIAKAGLADLNGLGIPSNRLHLVHNGVSDATRSDREAVRRQWGISADDIVLGCVARLEPQKNPLFLTPLLTRLPAHVRLVWVGDGSLMESMRKCATEHGVTDRVLLPGWQHDARSMMVGFDVFVLPSLYEGFPFAILEAMAAGLPTVASDVDGVGEAVADGQTGFLCRPNDADQWLSRIATFVDDPVARLRCGKAAASRHREEFSLEAMARKTAEIYRRVVSN